MTEMRLVTASGLPAPGGHYSHAVIAGGLAFISGLLPVDPAGNALADKPFEVQVAQVFHNLDTVLTGCRSSRRQLVQVRVYLTDVGLWGPFNALYAQWMRDHRPARCIVPVPVLHFGVALELEAVAQVSVPAAQKE
ncbi:RidA family protein (plasmid) [Deinococcus psychrotolerans]|uniref:RidA family protein n=1 Tax=Deinococcus psychrotolerans TaxID=2489213 RepID=A0A3G8YRC7_9DEIO|nr:RidA family protein [Deinococcus psychrotolerans]AZI45104.1 RidA family protein [Deinococcus psychrotolerans]